jgi:colicin import membrane protein
MAESPYNINSGAFHGSIRQFGDKAGRGIERLGKTLAKPISQKEAEQKKAATAAAKAADQAAKKAAEEAAKADKEKATAAANKKTRAAATRRATAAHKVKLSRAAEFENQKTQKQVERVTAIAAAKAAATPAAPAAKPTAPKSAARKTSSGVSTDKDGVLKPVNPAKKPAVSKGGAAVNTKAGEAYND